MTSWQAFEDAVKAWALVITGLNVAVWENAPRPRVPEACVRLSWVSAPRKGLDEIVYTDVGGDALTELRPTARGPRLYVLQIAVESFSQAANSNARQYLERAPARSRWPRAEALLTAQNAAIATIGDARAADYKADDRWVSRWVCEARINATSAETDTVEGGIGSIATVAVTSAVSDESGALLPTPPNFQDEVMPE